MASILTPQGSVDCSELLPEERLFVGTSDNGILYLDPRRNSKTDEIWYPVVELDLCTFAGLDKILAPCRATACGTPEIKLVSKLCKGQPLSFWVNHKVHGTPRGHTVKHVTVQQLDVIRIQDIESLKVIA